MQNKHQFIFPFISHCFYFFFLISRSVLSSSNDWFNQFRHTLLFVSAQETWSCRPRIVELVNSFLHASANSWEGNVTKQNPIVSIERNDSSVINIILSDRYSLHFHQGSTSLFFVFMTTIKMIYLSIFAWEEVPLWVRLEFVGWWEHKFFSKCLRHQFHSYPLASYRQRVQSSDPKHAHELAVPNNKETIEKSFSFSWSECLSLTASKCDRSSILEVLHTKKVEKKESFKKKRLLSSSLGKIVTNCKIHFFLTCLNNNSVIFWLKSSLLCFFCSKMYKGIT